MVFDGREVNVDEGSFSCISDQKVYAVCFVPHFKLLLFHSSTYSLNTNIHAYVRTIDQALHPHITQRWGE